MKRSVLSLAALAIVGAANATQFTNLTLIVDPIPQGYGVTCTVLNDSIKAVFTNAFISNIDQDPFNDWLDVAWAHSFETSLNHNPLVSGIPSISGGSMATSAYNAVTMKVKGRMRGSLQNGTYMPGELNAILVEEIKDLSNGNPVPAGGNAAEFLVSSPAFADAPNAPKWHDFEISLTTIFDHPITHGLAVKDDLFYVDLRPGTEAYIDSITQHYRTVPEPASIAALGLGALGVIARRRRNR